MVCNQEPRTTDKKRSQKCTLQHQAMYQTHKADNLYACNGILSDSEGCIFSGMLVDKIDIFPKATNLSQNVKGTYSKHIPMVYIRKDYSINAVQICSLM